MSNAGKKVEVEYVGTLDDGTKFDASADYGETLKFTCGAGEMIPGFDKAVENMQVGETVKVHIEPQDAYGDYDEDAVMRVPLRYITQTGTLPVGERILLRMESGTYPMLVCGIDDEDMVTLDGNHDLAGKPLNFEITLVSVED